MAGEAKINLALHGLYLPLLASGWCPLLPSLPQPYLPASPPLLLTVDELTGKRREDRLNCMCSTTALSPGQLLLQTQNTLFCVYICMCVSECVSAWVLSDQARGQPSLLKFVFLVVVDTWVLAHLSACSAMLGSPKQSGYRRSGQEHCRWVGGCIPVVELHFIKIIPSPHYNSTSLHVFTRGPTKRLKYVPGCCYSGGMLMCW